MGTGMLYKRAGVLPIRNFITYAFISYEAGRNALGVVPVAGTGKWEREIIKHADLVESSSWIREIPHEQRKFYFRLDGTKLDPSYEDVYRSPYRTEFDAIGGNCVYALIGEKDTGIRIAWSLSQSIGGSFSEIILAVDPLKGRVYAPPNDRSYSWKTPEFAAVYLFNDHGGWRDWTEEDEKISNERLQQMQFVDA